MAQKLPSDDPKDNLMDPELYLKKHHVMTYIQDAVTFLLERKDEDAKTKPYELLAEYFKGIKSGTHVLFREYSFVSATLHNRASFVRLFWHSYAEVAMRGDMMRVVEYLSLLRLLCHDFPIELVHRVALVIFSHNAMENLVTFPDFLYTFQTVFYYESFLTRCEMICSNIASGQNTHNLLGGTVIVSMPSVIEQESSSRPGSSNVSLGTSSSRVCEDHSNYSNERQGDGALTSEDQKELCSDEVDIDVFMKAVTNLTLKIMDKEPWQAFPNFDVLTEVVSGLSKFSFYDFVLALSRNDAVNSEVGILPSRSSLITSDEPRENQQ